MSVRNEVFRLSMNDGTAYRIQLCVEPGSTHTSDFLKGRIAEALQRMSSHSRWQRFAAPVTQLSEEQLTYLTDLDNRTRLAWCAAMDRDGSDLGIGLGRYIGLADEPGVAEFAVTVVDEFQGQGVGTALLQRLIASAADNGFRALCGFMMVTNTRMIRLSRRFGAVVEEETPGYVRVVIALRDPQ